MTTFFFVVFENNSVICGIRTIRMYLYILRGCDVANSTFSQEKFKDLIRDFNFPKRKVQLLQ